MYSGSCPSIVEGRGRDTSGPHEVAPSARRCPSGLVAKSLAIQPARRLDPTHIATTVGYRVSRVITVSERHIRSIPVRDDGLVGSFFLPPGPPPYPVVITIGGSGGGIFATPALSLASHGIATLALAYFGVACQLRHDACRGSDHRPRLRARRDSGVERQSQRGFVGTDCRVLRSTVCGAVARGAHAVSQFSFGNRAARQVGW